MLIMRSSQFRSKCAKSGLVQAKVFVNDDFNCWSSSYSPGCFSGTQKTWNSLDISMMTSHIYWSPYDQTLVKKGRKMTGITPKISSKRWTKMGHRCIEILESLHGCRNLDLTIRACRWIEEIWNRTYIVHTGCFKNKPNL